MNFSWVLLQTLALAAGPQVAGPTVTGPNVTVQTLAGEPIVGTLQSLTSQQVVVDASGETQELPLSAVVALLPVEAAAKVTDAPAAWIELTDGGSLLATSYSVGKGTFQAALLGGGSATGPVKAVARVRLNSQSDQIAAQWEQILTVKPAADLLVIRKGESIDYLEGAVGDVTAADISFKFDGDNVSVKRPKVEGLIYFRPAADNEPASAVGRVLDAAGSESLFKDFKLSAGTPAWTTPSGVKVTCGWKQVSKIDFSRGKIVPLADLKIDSVDMPRLLAIRPERARKLAEEFMRPRFDQGPRGEPLRVGGKTFARGAAIHSHTRLEYRISGKYKRFSALVGLDDNESGGGSVRLVLEGDGRSLFNERLFSGAPAKPIEVDVSGVKRFTIRVEYGDESNVSDCLDLCEARMSK
ncbi:MAG: NPCBM/NEW2 domain-containing protein [Pirellulales bacterium]